MASNSQHFASARLPSLPSQCAFPFGRNTTHASVYWQLEFERIYKPSLWNGIPIVIESNLRGFFTARSRSGIHTPVLHLNTKQSPSTKAQYADFLLLCSRCPLADVVEAHRSAYPHRPIDVMFVMSRVDLALDKLAGSSHSHFRASLSAEFDLARWYTETWNIDCCDAAEAQGQMVPKYVGPADLPTFPGPGAPLVRWNDHPSLYPLYPPTPAGHHPPPAAYPPPAGYAPPPPEYHPAANPPAAYSHPPESSAAAAAAAAPAPAGDSIQGPYRPSHPRDLPPPRDVRHRMPSSYPPAISLGPVAAAAETTTQSPLPPINDLISDRVTFGNSQEPLPAIHNSPKSSEEPLPAIRNSPKSSENGRRDSAKTGETSGPWPPQSRCLG